MARKAVLDGAKILQSDRAYDWLGPGAYFWESDPFRAKEWAIWKTKRGDYKEPAVIGAIIDLRHCLDLVTREDIEVLRAAHDSFKLIQQQSGLPMPTNRNPDPESKDADRILRFLDCAVFRHLHSMVETASEADPTVSPYDTVRGMFVEGGEAYPGSGLQKRSHVQIAVRNTDCIKGIFYPLDDSA